MQPILTTHTGSLPRPDELLELMQQQENTGTVASKYADLLQQSVNSVVKRQAELGLDFVNDGEFGRISYATYITRRLTGFGGPLRQGHIVQDLKEYKNLARRLVEMKSLIPDTNGSSCIGRVETGDLSDLEQELAVLDRARQVARPRATFVTAASPGIISVFQLNEYYSDELQYIEAIAEAMRAEYHRIVAAGHLLQLDCPDLAMNRHLGFAGQPEQAFLERLDHYIEAINHATADIAPEQMRLHLCWGNYQGPHHHDIALETILPFVLRARPATICLEAANPRHAHEWEVFSRHSLPADKKLAVGVLDTCSNYVEHREWIAQRLCQYAEVIAPEQLLAGSDCGFSSFAGYPTVDPDVVWLKLQALVEGAELATARIGQRRKR